MKSIAKTVAAVAVSSLLLAGCQQHAKAPQTVNQASNQFGLQTLRYLAKQGPKQNLTVSPISITDALAMAYAGARQQTQAQLAKTLGFNAQTNMQMHRLLASLRPASGQYQLSMANSAWVAKDLSLNQSYVNTVRQAFFGTIQPVDFSQPAAAQQAINSWVKAKTQGQIPALLNQPLSPLAKLVLLNAVYFHAMWAQPFPAMMTHARLFYMAGGQHELVPMMGKIGDMPYFATQHWQVVALPYQDKDVSMLILLPKDRDMSAQKMLASLSAAKLTQWSGMLKPTRVVLHLPKFTMNSDINFVPMLTSMGVTDMFNAKMADFSGISTTMPLYVSLIKQKAKVEVNEKGTTAAAASAVGMNLAAVMTEPVESHAVLVNADHPFVYVIWNGQQQTALFMGVVQNPHDTENT